MTTYSAFFASGLLAPRHDTNSHFDDCAPLSDSDIEVDDRETTPTPHHRPALLSNATTTATQRPRLRKRRSSLTIASSPMNAIRSPSRSAGAALQLQMHLSNPSRSRSGSVSKGVNAAATESYAPSLSLALTGLSIRSSSGSPHVTSTQATESTGVLTRRRSTTISGMLRPRKGVRRLASVPAPAAPPPTAPLPAVPSVPARALPRNHSTESVGKTAAQGGAKGRGRAFSLTGRIDENTRER